MTMQGNIILTERSNDKGFLFWYNDPIIKDRTT